MKTATISTGTMQPTKLNAGGDWAHADAWNKLYPDGWDYGRDTDTLADKEPHLLKVSENPSHSIYYREYGNPQGEPVIVVHGGPGGGCQKDYVKYFDPQRYRVILFDQRGNGKSEPSVNKGGTAALENNNTAELIQDINKLREKLGIHGKAHLFGGSWGSTLSLAYAIEHPENVQSLMLRGIFLGRRSVFDYFYQGNAAGYDTNVTVPGDDATPQEIQAFLDHYENQPSGMKGSYRAYMGDGVHLEEGQIPAENRTPGMQLAYAKCWHEFVSIIPEDKRHDMVAAYSEIFEMPEPLTPEQREFQVQAALAWSRWEGLTSYLVHQEPIDLGKFSDPDFALDFARIENRYFMHGCYLGMKPGDDPASFYGKRDNNFILENVHRLKGIPMFVTHPPTDQVTLHSDAVELVDAVKQVNGEDVHFVEPICGHSMLEKPNADNLTDFTARAPVMTEQEINYPYGWYPANESYRRPGVNTWSGPSAVRRPMDFATRETTGEVTR